MKANFYKDILMLIALCFDTPAVVSLSVVAVASNFGGLELESEGPDALGYTNYKFKIPKEISGEDVLVITEEIATMHDVSFVRPADPQNFSEVLSTVRSVTEALAREQPGSFASAIQFDPKLTTTPEQLLFGLLTKCGDGNNLKNAITYHVRGREKTMAYMTV